MKYLLLMFAWWGVFTTDGFSADEWESWVIFADFKTEEVLALNITQGKFNLQTQVMYSTNNGKYIPLKVASFNFMEGVPQYTVNFPSHPKVKYILSVYGFMSCGYHIKCENPDRTIQRFYRVGYEDSSKVPKSQYGKFLLALNNPSDNETTIFMDDSTKEKLALFKLNEQWHLLYKSPQAEKYIELNITSENEANASLTVIFPNDKSKKYKIKFIHNSMPMSSTLWVFNPDSSEQYFSLYPDYMSIDALGKKSPAQIYQELLGK